MLIDQMMDHTHLDFEAIETCLRSSMLDIGREALQGVLNLASQQTPETSITCAHGHTTRPAVICSKHVMTVLGWVDIRRPYYYDASCQGGSSPYDRILDVDGRMSIPGVRNMMANVGAKGPFREGAEDLQRLAGLSIPTKSIERLCGMIGKQVEAFEWQQAARGDMRHLGQSKKYETLNIQYDGTGAQVLKRETAGKKGKGKGGEAKTREVKVGCVFTQTQLNTDGYPERDESSTSYVGACEGAAGAVVGVCFVRTRYNPLFGYPQYRYSPAASKVAVTARFKRVPLVSRIRSHAPSRYRNHRSPATTNKSSPVRNGFRDALEMVVCSVESSPVQSACQGEPKSVGKRTVWLSKSVSFSNNRIWYCPRVEFSILSSQRDPYSVASHRPIQRSLISFSGWQPKMKAPRSTRESVIFSQAYCSGGIRVSPMR